MSQHIKPQIVWTHEKINLLREEYPLGDKKALAAKLGIKYSALKSAAARFNTSSLKDQNHYRLKNLYNTTPESYYWHGFIVADGHVGEHGELRLCLSVKDRNHLEKLKSFLNCVNPVRDKETLTNYGVTRSSYFCCCDAFHGKKFLEQYKITGPKTYNPPDLSSLDDEVKFLSFFMGFFDGDGCFDMTNNRPFVIKIEIHSSWIDQLKFIEEGMRKYWNIDSIKTTINSRGFAQLRIYKQDFLKKIKRFAQEHNLPILERKWDKVDMDYIPRKHKVNHNYELITKMRLDGISWQEICLKIDMKDWRTLKRSYNKLQKSLTVSDPVI